MAVIMSQATRTIDKIAEYALNDKEGQEGDRYVVATGVGCHPTTFKQQARSDRRRANKLRGYVEGYALVQSFAKYELDPTQEDDWERANELGIAIGQAVADGRPFIVVTQLDGKSGCLHNHIVISSVHPITGRSFDSSVVTHGVLARTHDQVLAANGFVQTTELKAHRQLHDSTKKIAMRAAGQYVWTDDLTARVESALADERAVDETSFLAVLGEHGIDVGPNPDRSKKDWTFGMADAEKVNEAGEPVYRKARGSRLAAHLTKPAIGQQLAQKQRQLAANQQQPATTPVSAPAPTEPAQTGVPTTVEETYAAIFGDALGPTSAPAPVGRQASTEPVDDATVAPPVSAPAPTEEVVVGAPALATTDKEEPYVSRLRQLKFKKPDADREKLRDDLAAFDEETRVRLSQGQRPVDTHVPRGVGVHVLKVWGKHLDPDVLAQLQMRQDKKHQARTVLWGQAQDAREAMNKHEWWTDEHKAWASKMNAADRRREQLLAEIADGIYEPVQVKHTGGSPKPNGGEISLRPAPGRERDDNQLV